MTLEDPIPLAGDTDADLRLAAQVTEHERRKWEIVTYALEVIADVRGRQLHGAGDLNAGSPEADISPSAYRGRGTRTEGRPRA